MLVADGLRVRELEPLIAMINAYCREHNISMSTSDGTFTLTIRRLQYNVKVPKGKKPLFIMTSYF